MNRDNQQERLHFDIGYFIGMVDGEGCYQMCPNIVRGITYWSPAITIANTDPLIVERTSQALDNIGLPYHVWSPKLIKGHDKRIKYIIQIKGIKRVKKATDLILRFSSGKKERAKLLNDFCNFRLSIPRGKVNQWGERYSDREREYKDKLSELNSHYKGAVSSETTRSNTQTTRV